MEAKTNARTMSDLQQRRIQLRERLAQAWVRREPLETIRQIENELRHLWTQIDAAKSERARSIRRGIGPPPADRVLEIA